MQPVTASGAGISVALAQLQRYWRDHPAGRPAVTAISISLRLHPGTSDEKMAELHGIAGWLGVAPTHDLGTWHVRQTWEAAGETVTVEAHHTPDQDVAFALQQEAAALRQASVQAVAV